MLVKPCPFCKKAIPRAMTACPYCHRDEQGQPVKMDPAALTPKDQPSFFEDDLKLLSSDDAYLREQAVVRMAHQGFGIVQNLISILEDHAKPGLAAVAKTLGRIRDRRSIPVLAQAARQGDDALRTAAVWALAQFREMDVLPTLLAEVSRPPVELQSFLTHALGNFQDPRVLSALMKLSKHSNREVAFQAVCALGETGDRAAVPALRRALTVRDPLLRLAATASLRRLGASAGGAGWAHYGRWIALACGTAAMVAGLLWRYR